MNTNQSYLQNPPVRPLRCIVKLGGAAITCKNEMEKINDESLEIVSSQLRRSMILDSSRSSKIIGMDWSKRDEDSEISLNLDDFEAQELLEFNNFIIVHGAGSFGHFQASKSEVHKGGLERSLVKAGFVATRISVTKLNLDIVRALAREGIPSIGMSPFACGWSTCGRKMISADVSGVATALSSGFVPVLHGDAVLDQSLGCTILSGDVIIRYLAEHLKPEYVVFLTDVLGVYNLPPTDPNAVLLREIAVKEDGTWSVVQPKLDQKVEITVSAHDTTGGMMTKINEAAIIAKLGIDVYIVKATTDHSIRAMQGALKGSELPHDWLGTVVRFSGVM